MKEVRALDIDGNGLIDEAEFKRLYKLEVLVAGQVKVRADAMWEAVATDAAFNIERLKCWDMILADAEMGYILGQGFTARGISMMLKMKETKALNISGTGRIDASEFQRLYNLTVIAAAEAAVP